MRRLSRTATLQSVGIFGSFFGSKCPRNYANHIVVIYDETLQQWTSRQRRAITNQIASSSMPAQQITMRGGHEANGIEVAHGQAPPAHADFCGDHGDTPFRLPTSDHTDESRSASEAIRRNSSANSIRLSA